MKGAFTALLGVLIFAGCATTANYEKILDSWLGAPADRLLARWGAPTGTFNAPNGNQIYIYDNSSTGMYTTPTQVHQAPGTFVGNTYFPGRTTVTGGQVIPVHRRCRTEFTIDQSSTIVTWRYEGNACVARSPD